MKLTTTQIVNRDFFDMNAAAENMTNTQIKEFNTIKAAYSTGFVIYRFLQGLGMVIQKEVNSLVVSCKLLF